MRSVRLTSVALIFSVLCLSASQSAARAIRFDDGLGVCETELPGGSREVPIVTFDNTPNSDQSELCDTFADPRFSGFSVNYFGTEYDTLFINDNGTLSFGAAFDGSVADSIVDQNTPLIAGLFAEGPTRVKIGYTIGTFTVDIDLLDAPGSFNRLARSQIIFIDRGDGNFDLELNYGAIASTGVAQAGFTDGLGGGYLMPGSGVADAFVGDDLALGGPDCTPTSLACGSFYTPGISDNNPTTGMPALGRYRFNFVDGVPQSVPGTAVPAPGSLLLMLFGLAALRARRGAA